MSPNTGQSGAVVADPAGPGRDLTGVWDAPLLQPADNHPPIWRLDIQAQFPANEAAELLHNSGTSAEVVSCYSVKPLDLDLLERVFDRFPVVATIEEHSLVGGFGSAVAEWLVDTPGRHARLVRIGTPDRFLKEAGEQEYARERFGLTARQIAARLTQMV